MLEAAGREDQMTGTESMIRAAPAGGGRRLLAAIGEGQGGFFFFFFKAQFWSDSLDFICCAALQLPGSVALVRTEREE